MARSWLFRRSEKETTMSSSASTTQTQDRDASLQTQTKAGAQSYEIDPSHSSASFKVRHLMISNVRGEFRQVAGRVVIDEVDVTRSTIEVTIDASSIDTHDPKRDEHLRSADFFDTAKYPTLTFKSTRVQAG